MERTQISKPDNPQNKRVHIRLPEYQLEYFSENNIQRSGWIRDLIDNVLVDDRTNLSNDQTTLTDYTQPNQ